MHCIQSIGVVLFCFVILSAMGADGVFQRFVESYGYETWKGVTKFEYNKRVEKWELPDLSMNTNGMSIAFYARQRSDNLWVWTLTDIDSNNVVLKINVELCENVIAAHRSIMELLSNRTSTKLYERCGEIGDQGFYLQREIFSGCVFARNNVWVHISSYSSKIDALNIAKQIDKDILKFSRALPTLWRSNVLI